MIQRSRDPEVSSKRNDSILMQARQCSDRYYIESMK